MNLCRWKLTLLLLGSVAIATAIGCVDGPDRVGNSSPTTTGAVSRFGALPADLQATPIYRPLPNPRDFLGYGRFDVDLMHEESEIGVDHDRLKHALGVGWNLTKKTTAVLTVDGHRNGVYRLGGDQRLPELNDVEIDLHEDVVRTRFGDLTSRTELKAPDDSMFQQHQCVRWSLAPNNADDAEVSLTIGRLKQSSRFALHYDVGPRTGEDGAAQPRICYVLHYQLPKNPSADQRIAGHNQTKQPQATEPSLESSAAKKSIGGKKALPAAEDSKAAGSDSEKPQPVTTRIAIGEVVPDFQVTIDGKRRKFSELRSDKQLSADGVMMLTFWCSFCDSCRFIEHRLDKLAAKHKGKVGIIALDASFGETTARVAEVAKKQKLTLPIALNPAGTAADIFGARSTTTTVIIDGKGVLRFCGQFADYKHNYAEEALQAVLAGKRPKVEKTRQKG